MFSQAFRRPLISTAVAVGVVAATAAGYTTTTSTDASRTAFTVNADAARADRAPTQRLADEVRETRADVAETQRRSALAAKQQAAKAVADAKARKVAAAKAAKAAEAAKARKAAGERAARQKARVSIQAKAQSNPRAIGRMLASDLYGWGDGEFSCLDSLWTKESGWTSNADNPTSDAYGIPQALPGSKMSSMGSDWATNPATQIKWGLKYINDRYGSPCSAWSQSRSANWY